MDGLMWDRCADGQTDIRMPRCAKEPGLKMKTGTESLRSAYPDIE